MFKTKTILFLLIIGLITANVIASLNPPTSSSRGTKTYLNYTDMMNETGLRNGSISNITWIGFTPEKVGGTLQLCPTSAVNNATLCYNQTSNNLKVSLNGSRYKTVMNNESFKNSSLVTVNQFDNGTVQFGYSTPRHNISSFTRNLTSASGTQVITGIGFTPVYVQFYAVVGGTTQMSWGFDDGIVHKNIIFTSAGAGSADGGNSIDILQPDGATSQVAYISSLDSDGFTLTWTKAGSPTGNVDIMYTAFR